MNIQAIYLFILDVKLSVPPMYMDLYTIGSTIEPPFIWYIQKCMLIWKICFYFSFVVCDVVIKKTTRHVKRPPFTEKRLLRRTIFNSRAPFTYYDWEE